MGGGVPRGFLLTVCPFTPEAVSEDTHKDRKERPMGTHAQFPPSARPVHTRPQPGGWAVCRRVWITGK